ncbi:MAG: ADP-ribose pyrophosphatase [Chlamydiae bacterium]|nr:ADP-ribose pyrophosphatase [Chlamydiota bacterium]
MLYQGNRVDLLSIETTHPDGGSVRREVVSHPGAVVILPMLDEDTVLLIRNERPCVLETLWELPAGTLEAGEEPIACAARELEEETGYRAASLEPLLEFYTSPGFCNELLYIFLAKDLSFVGQNLDETEKIEVVPTSLPSALEMITDGTIRDGKTIASLLFFIHR